MQTQRSNQRGKWSTALLILATLGAALLLAPLASAEQAWVRGGVRLNLRTEPGTQYRIVGGVGTGDGVKILKRGENWTKVQLPDGKSGWIPVGYLQSEPPASVRLETVEGENVELKVQVDELRAQVGELSGERDRFAGEHGTQVAEIESLRLDNVRLKAAGRYPEMLMGAAILAAGMVLGAFLRGSSSRRQATRIRI